MLRRVNSLKMSASEARDQLLSVLSEAVLSDSVLLSDSVDEISLLRVSMSVSEKSE